MKTFFLIDDDADDTELFQEAIGEVDDSVACHSASDGRQALHKLHSKDGVVPDIIFLDINMPDMSGWQLLLQLKEDENFRHIPVIMYSTSSQKSDLEKAKDSGALCFVVKPDTFSRLKKIVEVVLSHMENNLLKSVCESLNKLQPRFY
jgi:CheY-like chemotaxis protein